MTLISNHAPWVPASEGERLEIRKELESILASPPFRNSQRYPSLLRYVVEKTLSGEAEALKERTIGVEVFRRAADYDTNADPVVRFSAGEVRRRIAQFYRGGIHGRVEIALPVGSYVPQFSRREASEGEKPTSRIDEAPLQSISSQTEASEQQIPVERHSRYGNRAGQGRLLSSFLTGLLFGALVVTVLGLVGYFFLPAASRTEVKTPVTEVWGSLLTHPDAVLISAGRTRVIDDEPPEPPNATIEQHILRPEARMSFSAVQAISQVVGFLQTHHKQFRIHEAESNNLQDLRLRPVVLIAAYNNMWTLRLLRPLRFHFEQAGSLHYIVDAKHPDSREWSVAFNMPYRQETEDYAIIGRFYDPTTGGPVVVVAGIGSNGSEAAGEFIVSPDSLESLARLAPDGKLDKNFEAVLKVQVIAGDTGAAAVVATQFW
ncbi:MAG: hypothetical protein ACRD3N_03770 [Terracidiphilus sp.]